VLATSTLLLLVEARQRQRARWWFAAGVLGAAAALVRENFILFLAAAILWTTWRTRRTGLRPALLLALAAVVTLLPSALHNFSYAGEFLPLTSQAGQNFFIGNHPGNPDGGYLVPDFVRRSPRFEETDFAREAERRLGRSLTAGEISRHWREEALRFIRENPAGFLQRFAGKLGLLYNDFEIPDDEDIRFFRRFAPVLRLPLLTFGVFGVLGLFGFLVHAYRRTLSAELALFVGVYSVSVALFFVFARYRLPLVAPLAVLAAERLQAGVRVLGARRFRRLGLALLAMVPLALLVYRPLDARTTFANSHLTLGIAYEVRGENAAAIREYRRGLELEPENAKLLRRLARLVALAVSSPPGAPGGATATAEAELLDLLERAVRANPEDVELRFRRGTALARAGRAAEAAAQFEWILERGASPPGVHANLAFLYEELGRAGEARTQARLALARTPGDSQLEKLLQRLGDR
jgi:tetratricopeptide (TPR) repeat protein